MMKSMTSKIPEETRQLIERLFTQGVLVAEIARRVHISYPTVYGYTRAKQRGFASRTKYEEHLAQQRGFASLNEYKKHQAQQRGFASLTEYEEHLVQQRGFASINEYREHLAQQRDFASLNEYWEHLAQQMGFASLNEYKKHQAQQRQKRPQNRELGNLVKRRLRELGKTQSWLAEQLEITEGAVSRYVSGETTPRKRRQGRFFEVLGLPYSTIDEVVGSGKSEE